MGPLVSPRTRRLWVSTCLFVGFAWVAHAAPESADPPDSTSAAGPQQSALQSLDRGLVASAGAGRALFAVDLLDADAVSGRVLELDGLIEERREALAALRSRLAHVEDETPRPARPTPPPSGDKDPLALPSLPSVDELLGEGPHTEAEVAAATERHKAARAEALAALERRKAERTQAAADHAEAMRAYEVEAASWQGRVAEARTKLAREADDAQVKVDVAILKRRYLQSVKGFLDATPSAARTALRSLRRAGELERTRGRALAAMDKPLAALAGRTRMLADRAVTGAFAGFHIDVEVVEQSARRAGRLCQARGEAVAAVARRIEELGARLDERWDRVAREVVFGLRAPGLQGRIDTLYGERLQAERRGRRTLRGRRPGEGPTTAQVIEQLDKALSDPDGLSSISEANAGLSESQHALGLCQGQLDEQELTLAWRELAFDRQLVAALAPHISEALRGELHGVGLRARWLSDGRLEALDARDGLDAWARDRLSAVLNPSLAAAADARLGWILGALLGFGLALRLRAPLRTAVLAVVRLAVRTPSLRGQAGAVVRWGVLAEAVVGPTWTFVTGLLALQLIGDGLPELVALRSVFVWTMGYSLGKAAWVGLTTHAGPGRPPLLLADNETSVLLATTWRRIGLPVVVTGVLDDLARAWLVGGVLSSFMRVALWLLLAAWALWTLVAWRPRLARWWVAGTPEGTERRLAQWYASSLLGALLTPTVVVRLLASSAWRAVRGLLAAGGALAWFQSRRLAREARLRGTDTSERRSFTVPEDYCLHFGPESPVQSDGALPPTRAAVLDKLLGIVGRWERDPGPGAAMLCAESGMGKTVVLDHLERSLDGRFPVLRARLTEKLLDPDGLARHLATGFGLDPELTPEALAKALNDGERRVVVVDDVHHTFLRTVGGYKAFDALVRLVVASGDGTFWVLAIGQYSWGFLSRRRSGEHHFDDVVHLPPLTPDELEQLITRRHETTGCRLVFDELIHSGDVGPAESGLRLVESVEGFFRLLAEASGGNPNIAQGLWLDSLSPGDDGALKVGLFPTADDERIKDAGEQALFALAAFILHETLTTQELATVINVRLGDAEAVVERLRARGVLSQEVDEPRGRLTVSPSWYRPTIRLLHRKHLL